jgi:hypothetical protein
MNNNEKKLRAVALAITWLAVSPPGHAAPMGFKDSWMVMGDFDPNWRDLYANYAFTPQDAFGVDTLYMRSDDKLQTLDLVDATYTRLIHRWNLPDAQANFWFMGGLGEARRYDQRSGLSDTKWILSPGLQFDYETARVYFAAATQFYRAEQINHDMASLRTGFSFYETEFDETQPWFIIEARRMHDLSDKTEITPMLRLINKNYFIEAGVNNSRQFLFNFMYTL